MEDYRKGLQRTYTYDALNQLQQEEIWEKSQPFQEINGLESQLNKKFMDDAIQKIYTYDQRGNLTGEYQNGELLHGYTFSAMNRMEKAWDNAGRETKYFYNGLRQRTGRSTNGRQEDYLLDLTKSYHNLLAVEIGEDRQNFYWDFGVAAMEEKGRLSRYYLRDELGSSLRVLNKNGKGDVYGYDEFGRDFDNSEKEYSFRNKYSRQDEGQPFGYTGYCYDKTSGTYFAQAREFKAELGRFTAEDVLKSGINWYIYCDENPTTYVDRNGLESYVFYTTEEDSDFTKQAEWRKEQLEQQGEVVVMIPVATASDFTKGWDGMGEIDNKEVDIGYVEVYTHGNAEALIFVNGSSTEAINIIGTNSKGNPIPKASDLEDKEVNELNIYACNAGNYLVYFNKGNNIAAEFSKKTMGAPTYAYDGNVAFGTPIWKLWAPDTGYAPRLSTTQRSFNKIRALYNSNVKPRGELAFMNGEWCVYGFYNNAYITNMEGCCD